MSKAPDPGFYQPGERPNNWYLFYQGGTGYVNTPYPYAGTGFEPSPLNRTTEQGAPGLPWQLSTAGVTGGGHTVQTDYSVNDQTAFTTTPVTGNAGSHMAALYTASVSSNQNRTLARTGNNATYDNGQLDLTISKDENWNAATDGCLGTVEQYKDKEGHILLKRTYNLASAALQMLSTYYVYDDFGNLAFVLPPGANPDNNAAITQATLDNLCYQYRYDERGRLSQKKLPGKGWEYTVYNQIDQPVATQDSLQRANNQWIYTKYDAMARVIISGIWTNGGVAVSRGALQSGMNSQTVYWDSPANTGLGYTILAWPNNSVTPLSINYYDVYTGIPSFPSAYSKPTNGSRQTKGLLTATKTAVLNNPANMLWTVPYYDDLGRNVKGYSQHYLGGTADTANYDAVTSTYNFNNQPTTTNRQHFTTASATIPKVTIYNRYTYDHLGRKLNTYEQIQNGSAAADTLRIIATAVYNEIGQLQTKSLHSKDSLDYAQSIAYTYNERGWLLSSSAAKFAMTLYYTNGTTPQYNGNIANQYWGTAGNLANHWTYTYDRLNRLTSGMSTAGNHENGITYDVMGNMKTLQRYAASSRIDKLTYTMISGTNQLQSVTDSSGSNLGLINGTMGYTYDGNGNMLAATNTVHNAQNKSFTYNLLNLPIVATVPTGTITYTYTAAGTKLRKVSVLNGVTKTTDYIGGIEYDGDGTTNTLSFVQTDEGKAVPLNATMYDYNYYLSDNLGNTRYTLSTLTAGYQQDDYYPFGMDINTHLASPKNEYLYNKKELQEEFTEYDYGARFYDPVVARWTSVDPRAEKSRRFNPYNYALDNPIRFIDPDGREIINIPNGVSFTGEDAKIVFGHIKQQIGEQGGIKGIHYVHESKTPTIYKDLLMAFRMGKPNVLHQIKNNPKLKQQNADNALDGYPIMKSLGLERQEYPYRSTYEGGKGAYVTYVPEGEQRIEGGELSVLSKKLKDKDAFLVVPDPEKEEPDLPNIPVISRKNLQRGAEVGLGTVIAIGAYEAAKWGIAAFLAPETLGGSLVGAAAIP